MSFKRLPTNHNPDAKCSYAREKNTTKNAYQNGVSYDNGSLVNTTHFDFSSIDNIREQFLESDDPDEFLEQYADYKAEKKIATMALQIISMFHNEKKDIFLNLDVLIEVFDIPFNGGESYRSLSEKHAITVEAFCKRMEKVINQLGIRGPRNFKRNRGKKIYNLTNNLNHTKIHEEENTDD